MRELAFIEKFLMENGDYVREKYLDKSHVTVTSKGDPGDLLTEVDLTVQKRFVDAVSEAFPDDLIVGEESGLDHIPEDPDARAWVIDPIDGTYNFVRGINPAFAVAIAFVDQGYAQAAGVLMPVTRHLFFAQAGGGATCNGRRLLVSQVQRVEEACVEIDFSAMEDRRLFVRRGVEILRQAGQIRCQGSAVVGICQIATGDVDAYVHMTLCPWDYAAAQLIAEEAGAMSSRLDGSALRVFDGGSGVLVSNGAIHQSLLGLFK